MFNRLQVVRINITKAADMRLVIKCLELDKSIHIVEISKKVTNIVIKVSDKNEWDFERECLKNVGKLITPGSKTNTVARTA